MSRTYTQKEFDEVVEEAYNKGREDGYKSAASNYEYEGY